MSEIAVCTSIPDWFPWVVAILSLNCFIRNKTPDYGYGNPKSFE
jgi:hypothetical protein